jgi:hypothetical protein
VSQMINWTYYPKSTKGVPLVLRIMDVLSRACHRLAHS